MPVPTSGIDHVHLNVADIDRFVVRFTEVLECVHNIPLYVDSIQALNSMNTLGLDVFEPQGSDGIAAKQMARFGGPGITTVSFHVEDLDSATAAIEAQGVRCISRIGYPGVERQSQFHPRDCFGMVLELVEYVAGHEAVVAEIKAKQAAENDGRTGIPSPPGALANRGIDHVHLRATDIDAVQAWFSRLFDCQWDAVAAVGGARAARSSIGVQLVEAETAGLGSLAFAVEDLAAAERRCEELGLASVANEGHAEAEPCLRIDPTAFEGLGVEFVAVSR